MKRKSRKSQDLDDAFVGLTFGRLKVIKLIWIQLSPVKRRRKAQCQCDCGTECLVNPTELEMGDTRSCGCFRRERTIERCLEDLTGKRFGKLIATERVIKRGKSYWRCRCDCGGDAEVYISKLTTGETRSCGCICRAKGKDHFNWDVTIPEQDRLMKRGSVKNPLYEEWRKKVYQRDGYTCQLTGQRGDLVAHHLYAWNRYPDKRYDPDNGVTLLASVHRTFHRLYGRGDNTREEFDEFKERHRKDLSILSCSSCEA